ncbi:MAG: M48 family metallopeptidase [Acidobacteriota bacterium]
MQNRFQHSIRALRLGSILCLLFAALLAPAATRGQEQDKQAKEKEKKGVFTSLKDKVSGKEPDDEETELEYRKLLTTARAKYDNTVKPRFKRRVDQAYKQKRREHNDYAFRMNTFNSNDELTTFTGDKLKEVDTIYDNMLVQDYINRVGHSLVPTGTHRYAFKVVLDPVPDARALTTGTIFLTTGLLSLVDTEAQLAYVLAHEIAHVEKRHWLEDAMVATELEDQEIKKAKISAGVGLAAGLAFGIGTKSLGNGVGAGLLGGLGTYGLLKFFDNKRSMEWEKVQENEADELGMKLIFDRNYDPREIPKFYARLQELTEREPRLSDGFLARGERIGERVSYLAPALGLMTSKAQMLRGGSNLRRLRAKDATDSATISPIEAGKSFKDNADFDKREKEASQQLGKMTEVLNAKLQRNEIIAGGEEFDKVMADLKRDNGVRAFYYDMFNVALENLRESRQLRSDDPQAHYYYGKVLQLTAKDRAEKAEAFDAFKQAISYDRRGVLAEPYLHKALMQMSDANPNQNREIIEGLEKYVDIFQRTHNGSLPPNMDSIYAYLKGMGEHDWAAHPVMNVVNSRPTEGTRGVDTGANPPAETAPRIETPRTPEVKPAPEPKTPAKKKP